MSSTDLPWYKEYATNTLAQTLELDFEELGIYQHLKLKYWCERETGLSTGILDRISLKCDKKKFDYIISKFFVEIDGYYHLKDLKEQIEKQKENSIRQKKVKVTDEQPLGDLKVEEKKPPSSSSSSSSSNKITKIHPAGFEMFWKDIKKKIGKGHCRRAYNKLPGDWLLKPLELSTLYNQHCDNNEFSKHPATWLNGECYLDEDVKTKISEEDEQKFLEKKDKEDWEFAKKMGRWLPAFSAEKIRRCEDKFGKIES